MYNTYVKVRILADFPDIVCSSGFLHHQCDVPNFDVGTLWFLPALCTNHAKSLLQSHRGEMLQDRMGSKCYGCYRVDSVCCSSSSLHLIEFGSICNGSYQSPHFIMNYWLGVAQISSKILTAWSA